MEDREAARALEATLHRLVPISHAMGIAVASAKPREVILAAPLALNHNHAGSGFAGSVYAVASLAGWALLRQTVESEGISAHLVLAEGHIRYHQPLEHDIHVAAELNAPERDDLIAKLRQGRNARLKLRMEIADSSREPAAVFTGTYFAKPA